MEKGTEGGEKPEKDGERSTDGMILTDEIVDEKKKGCVILTCSRTAGAFVPGVQLWAYSGLVQSIPVPIAVMVMASTTVPGCWESRVEWIPRVERLMQSRRPGRSRYFHEGWCVGIQLCFRIT